MISYRDLLNIFWNSHAPEYKSPSKQYMSIIFYHNEKQKKIANETLMEKEKRINSKIYTEIVPYREFYLAENYHQKYYLQLVRELMDEFQTMYSSFRDFIDSTSAAHINGYIKGYGTIEMLSNEIKDLGLSEMGQKRLQQAVEGYGR